MKGLPDNTVINAACIGKDGKEEAQATVSRSERQRLKASGTQSSSCGFVLASESTEAPPQSLLPHPQAPYLVSALGGFCLPQKEHLVVFASSWV